MKERAGRTGLSIAPADRQSTRSELPSEGVLSISTEDQRPADPLGMQVELAHASASRLAEGLLREPSPPPIPPSVAHSGSHMPRPCEPLASATRPESGLRAALSGAPYRTAVPNVAALSGAPYRTAVPNVAVPNVGQGAGARQECERPGHSAPNRASGRA